MILFSLRVSVISSCGEYSMCLLSWLGKNVWNLLVASQCLDPKRPCEATTSGDRFKDWYNALILVASRTPPASAI